MICFQIGDRVRVDGLPASEWRGISGVIVKIVERQTDGGGVAQECAVQFLHGRCWFLAEHLTRSAPEKTVRFFRSEALERWKDLSLEDVAVLNGNRDELIALLQERCGFAARRAGVEVDTFITEIHERIRIATTLSLDSNPASYLKISA
jgi:hypothetical protein